MLLSFDDVVPLHLRGFPTDKVSRVSCCLGGSAEWVQGKHVATSVPCTADGYCAATYLPATVRCTIHPSFRQATQVGQPRKSRNLIKDIP